MDNQVWVQRDENNGIVGVHEAPVEGVSGQWESEDLGELGPWLWVYVARDESGTIRGVFDVPQPGHAEEHVRRKAPEIDAYYAPLRAAFGDIF